jgi:hypothetical protein
VSGSITPHRRIVVKYLLLVTWDTERMNAQPDPEPATEASAKAAAATADEEPFPWLDELRATNQWLIGDQLAPPRRARTVRVRDGRKTVTDGPFTETKEAVGGFDLIEADSVEAAVEIASRHPVAAVGAIEVRPLLGGWPAAESVVDAHDLDRGRTERRRRSNSGPRMGPR